MFIEELKNKVEKTAKSRFESYRRMRRNRIWSNITLAIFSFYIIVINSLVFIEPFKSHNDVITLVTIFMSTFILIMSLLVGQRQYESRERTYHECGKKLSYLKDRIALDLEEKQELSYKEKEVFLEQYNEILNQYNLNHVEFDYKWAHKNLREHPFNYIWLVLRYYIFDVYFAYALMTLLTPLLCYWAWTLICRS